MLVLTSHSLISLGRLLRGVDIVALLQEITNVFECFDREMNGERNNQQKSAKIINNVIQYITNTQPSLKIVLIQIRDAALFFCGQIKEIMHQ